MIKITLYWLLLGLGAVACVATPVIDVLAGHGAEQHAASSVVIYIPFYLAGVFTFWKRPGHVAARQARITATQSVSSVR